MSEEAKKVKRANLRSLFWTIFPFLAIIGMIIAAVLIITLNLDRVNRNDYTNDNDYIVAVIKSIGIWYVICWIAIALSYIIKFIFNVISCVQCMKHTETNTAGILILIGFFLGGLFIFIGNIIGIHQASKIGATQTQTQAS